jgi:hypothetical protein
MGVVSTGSAHESVDNLLSMTETAFKVNQNRPGSNLS